MSWTNTPCTWPGGQATKHCRAACFWILILTESWGDKKGLLLGRSVNKLLPAASTDIPLSSLCADRQKRQLQKLISQQRLTIWPCRSDSLARAAVRWVIKNKRNTLAWNNSVERETENDQNWSMSKKNGNKENSLKWWWNNGSKTWEENRMLAKTFTKTPTNLLLRGSGSTLVKLVDYWLESWKFKSQDCQAASAQLLINMK